MALYFKERIDEQAEASMNDKIVFTYPWHIYLPPPPNSRICGTSTKFKTTYMFHTAIWQASLSRRSFTVRNVTSFREENREICDWNGASCFVSFKIFRENNSVRRSWRKRVLQYSEEPEKFESELFSMNECGDDYNKRRFVKMIILIKIILPAKNFYRPFEMPSKFLSIKSNSGMEYPNEMESDFRFEFLKYGDYKIKCPDGTILASRMVLNISSDFLHTHFSTTSDDQNELIINHSLDVVKPIIIFLHTRLFQMPKVYDLDYVKRFLLALNYFYPEDYLMFFSIQRKLCEKFVREKTFTFESLLKWLKLAFQEEYCELEKMITTIIADKFYYDWILAFPENERNTSNLLFVDIFDWDETRATLVFKEIELNFAMSLLTNVILP